MFLYRLALTKLDILDVFPEIKVGVAYKLDGEVIPHFPGKATCSTILDIVEMQPETWIHWTFTCKIYDRNLLLQH